MNQAHRKSPNTLRLGKSPVRTTPDGHLSATDILRSLGLEGTLEELEHLAQAHSLEIRQHNLGRGKEPTLDFAGFVQLVYALPTPEAKRWQQKARELLRRYLEGDIQLAAEVAERSPSREHRRWLTARLESVESRKQFMSTVAKAGGQGSIYQQVSSLSNRSVLKMNSAELRKKRGARNTRDAMTAAELLRLSYLETASAKAIEAKGIRGNEEILKLHSKNAEIEQKLWESDPDFKPGA